MVVAVVMMVVVMPGATLTRVVLATTRPMMVMSVSMGVCMSVCMSVSMSVSVVMVAVLPR